MTTKKQKILGPKVQVNPFATLSAKLKRIKELRAELNKVKVLYQEHDQLMSEVLPAFIEVQADKFVIAREIKLGSKTYRLSPHFFDEKKGLVVPKVWKSTAFESATIE